ncbi:MAG: ABC transporter permease subunit [Ruminococcus sp.]|nr:ABC transporter permease subunit [Ruminococcus sp.]
MLSLPLLKQSTRSNAVMWGSMTGVMTLLCAQFSMLDMTRSLLFTIFYGMMTTILPGIYVLVTSNKLLASQVDRGSMAYVLATPTKRSTVTFTQAFFLVNSLIAMFGIMTGTHLLINRIKPLALSETGYPLQGDLTSKMILEVNLSALLVCIALASVCFMFSGIFSSSKYSIGLSGTFVGVSILANMMAMFGRLGVGGLDKFKYLTICSFYDYQSVLLNGNEWVTKLIYPAVIAVLAFGIGRLVFEKKDLPL